MRANILIVEDDPDILSSLAEVIREAGFDVETAANGYQALSRLETHAPDLILLDLMMPLMDGWKFLETARQRFPSRLTTPVVLLSAVHNLADEAHRLGVTAFLAKPFDLEDVVRVAHRFTQRRAELPRQGA